ncbi:phosphatase PAP2 family protein [Streptomyces sp. P1-3]|uniref:phosphatase PAP2 family protein n=1 Tax=Streptomyces sp. P1-3 TaxID=3421658 RepID=UPI003D368268
MPHTVPRTGASPGTRPRWWTELPLIAVVYAVYSAGRLLAPDDVTAAVNNGLGILRLERDLHIDFETPLNRIFIDHAWVGVPADFAYASLHYVATPAVLVWLWKRRQASYQFFRTWLLVATLIGLIGFTLMPTCPPRLLDAGYGFVDGMAHYSEYGWWGGEASAPRGLGSFTNQYAAMPSLHVGWALWCGVALWAHGRSVWAKIAAVVYPLSILLVVMGTANHYFMDGAAGIATMGIGALLARPVMRMIDRIRDRRRAAGTAGTAVAPVGADPVGAATEKSAGTEKPESAADVSAGCQTSARERERIPRQHGGGRGEEADTGAAEPATADGSAAAPAR